MQLPGNSIGISDILAYRECPRRMTYGMRRHVAQAEQSDAETPEAGSWATEYGSAIHTVIEAVEDGYSDEAAIQKAWDQYGSWLNPSDIDLLREDLEVYRSRDFPNTRTVLNEDEIRVPLMEWQGETIYFRAKIDRLYERLDAPGTFVHVDYKSSKHAKSQAEVHEDQQLWAYNFAIHEHFPEVDELLQFYDQLRYGQPDTRKTADQRRQMRDWLIKQVTTILRDDRFQDDGLLPYKWNRWCRWCPILESCGVVDQLTDFALTEIGATGRLVKEGRKTTLELDGSRLGHYAGKLEPVKEAKGILERFDKRVKELLKELPPEEVAALGFDMSERKNNVFSLAAKEALHEKLGPMFYAAAKVTKSELERLLADDPETLAWALDQATQVAGATVLKPQKETVQG